MRCYLQAGGLLRARAKEPLHALRHPLGGPGGGGVGGAQCPRARRPRGWRRRRAGAAGGPPGPPRKPKASPITPPALVSCFQPQTSRRRVSDENPMSR
eukprot:5481810-Pyramimonas_sp.AAC.1